VTTKPFIYKQFSSLWNLPFYSARGIKYNLTLLRVGYSLDGIPPVVALPISLTERGEVIVATYPDMVKEVFTGVNEVATHFDSTIIEFKSEDI
jgi:hypothetical protein